MANISAYLTLLIICGSVISVNAEVDLHSVSSRVGGLNGGGYFELLSANKFTSNKDRSGGAALAPPVTVNHQTKVGGLKNLTACRYIKYLSAGKKIFCSPDPVDTNLDGFKHPMMDLERCPHTALEGPPEMYFFVEGEGGPVQSDNGGVISGRCKYTPSGSRWHCSRKFLSSFTPVINSVTPRVAVPGQLITIYGATGFTDLWSNDEDDADISFKPRNMQEWFNADVEQRSKIGIKDKLIRVRIGDYVCETSDENGRPYRSYSKRTKNFLSDRTSWFQCRIPDSMPAGTYPIFFEEKDQGKSIMAAAGYDVSWTNASSGHAITVLPKSDKTEKVTVSNITTIKGTTILRLKGANLNKTGVKIYFGGKECTTVGTPTSKEVQCLKEAQPPMVPYLGPLGWLRERWLFVKKDTNTALDGAAWNAALFPEGHARESRGPDAIMDRIRHKDKYLASGYKLVRFVNLLPHASAEPVYDKSHDLFDSLKRRNSVFECVSGVYSPKRSGRVRINTRGNPGPTMILRIKEGDSRPNENTTWLLTQEWTAFQDDAWSAPVNVVQGKSYYVEFLLKMNTWQHRFSGGFSANFIYSYHRNDAAGATGSVSGSSPRRARSGKYVLRSSDVVTDKITIKITPAQATSFELTLWPGMKPVEAKSAIGMSDYAFQKAVRKVLQWATCDSEVNPKTDIALFPDDFNTYGHPFDADNRWLTSASTKQFNDPRVLTSVRVQPSRWIKNNYGGKEGASMDFSTAYCGASSQRIDLGLLPPGRIINPMTKNFHASQSAHPWLSFAYKLTAGAKATMILRFEQRQGKHYSYGTCAILLTHQKASSDISAHKTCIDLQDEVVADGSWRFLSFRWRDKVSTDFVGASAKLLVHGIGVGAQQWLDDCPTSQNAADVYTRHSNSELSGTMWLDQVAFTKTERSVTRTTTPASELGGLEEGKSAISHIGVKKTRVKKTNGEKYTLLHIEIARVDKCIGASGAPSNLAPFMPSISVSGGNKPAPTMTYNNRSATTGREDAGSKLSLATGVSAVDNNASWSDVAGAFKNAVRTDGIRVDDITDLYDTCAVRARRVYVAHASDLSSPQEGFKISNPPHTYSRSVRYARDVLASVNELNISVTRSDSSVGYMAELVANSDLLLNGGHVSLGSSGEVLNVRAPFDADEVQFRTAHVTDNDQMIPCDTDPSLLEHSKHYLHGLWSLEYLHEKILSGNTDCAMAVEEEVTADADAGGEGDSCDTEDDCGEGMKCSNLVCSIDETRRRLTSAENDDNTIDDSNLQKETHAHKYPGDDTWAHHSLHFSESELHGMATSIPSIHKPVSYGDVVKHGRRLAYNFSTSSNYELSSSVGNFSDTATWGGGPVPNSSTTDIIYIPAGTNLTLDQDVYIRVWIIEGRLDFSTLSDIHMEAEFIVVNGDDAHFTIGSPDQAYPKKAKITLHGHWRSLGLPKFGVKVLAMTSGRLTFYGPAVEPWALLEETAYAGTKKLKFKGKLQGWANNSDIVIAGTGYGWAQMSCRMDRKDTCETEERVIASSSFSNGTTTIVLTTALNYTHLGEGTEVPGDPQNRKVERRAEVILLNRMIQVTGTDVEGFGAHTMMLSGQMVLDYVQFGPNVGQAFQLGRYAIHYHTPNEHLFKNNLKFSDDPRMQGAYQGLSRTRGCSIHHSNNRVLTAHGCFGLNIERNVGYNVLGHGMFVEDGIEQLNVFKENVIIMIHRAFSLLNSDQTPAAFWITNANNRYIGNRAVGSHTFGFWFDPPTMPTGPSSDVNLGPLGSSFDANDWEDNFCATHRLKSSNRMSNKVTDCMLLQFENNTAHSNGADGVWIDHIDHKKINTIKTWLKEKWVVTVPQRQTMIVKGTTVYNNGGSGVGVVEAVGHIHIVDTIAMGNLADIMFIKTVADGWAGPQNNWEGPLVLNSALVGDRERQYSRRRHGKRNFALGLPHGGYVTFKDTFIANFTTGQMPIHHCIACGFPIKGGLEVRFNNTKFYNCDENIDKKGNVQSRGRVDWMNGYHSNILWDIDGTFTDTNAPGTWAHANAKMRIGDPPLGHFPDGFCKEEPKVNGITCNSSVSLREVEFRHIKPMYMKTFQVNTGKGKHASGSGMYHYDSLGRRYNWHVTLVMVKGNAKPFRHNFSWVTEAYRVDDADSWYAEIREMREDEWTIMDWPWLRNPYRFHFNRIDKPAWNEYDQYSLEWNRTTPSMTYASNIHGDWSYMSSNNGTEQRDVNVRPSPGLLSVMVSGKLNHDITYQREKGNMYSTKDNTFRFNGLNDEYPLCNGGCSRFPKIPLSMKKVNCAVGDTKRCLPMGKPTNCFSNEPSPEVSTEARNFKWCETVPGIWAPPAFGDDVIIKAGWTVRLGPDCLETNIVRHLDIYGSLIISDPGVGKQAILKAQTIHVASGMGYLEAGTTDVPIAEGAVRIELYGNRYSAGRFGYGLETKYLAVLGTINLVGKSSYPNDYQHDPSKRSVETWANLQSTSNPSSNTIAVEAYAHQVWNIGDKLMVGGGVETTGKNQWSQAEVCTINSIVIDGDNSIIQCEETFLYKHAGPALKGGHMFQGLPVTLMTPTKQHVAVVGMEDDTKALEEQMYGAIVAILGVKTLKGMDRSVVRSRIMKVGKPKALAAIASSMWEPPKECKKRQGTAIIKNVHFADCGQRDSNWGCVNFVPGRGGVYNVANDTSMTYATAVVEDSTFERGYNFGITAAGSGIKIHGNAATDMWNGGFKLIGQAHEITYNAAIYLKDDKTVWFHDKGSYGFYVMRFKSKNKDASTWPSVFKHNVVASGEYTGMKIGGLSCEQNPVESTKMQAAENRVYGCKFGFSLKKGETGSIIRQPENQYPKAVQCTKFDHLESRGTIVYGIVMMSGKHSLHLNNVAVWDAGTGLMVWLQNDMSGGAKRIKSDLGSHVEVRNSIFVGMEGSSKRCKNDGIAFSAFYAGIEPYRPDQGVKTPSRHGGTSIKNVKFVDFGICENGGNNYAMVNCAARARYAYVYEDVANPVKVSGLTFENVDDNNKVLMVRPSKGRIQKRKPFKWAFAQMYGDGHRNTFIMDEDGSLLGDGTAGTVIPENEFGWFEDLVYVDPLGRETMESLIPYTFQWKTSGERIGVPYTPSIHSSSADSGLQGAGKLYDEPGLMHDDCTLMPQWRAWKCPGKSHRQIIFESLDRDHSERRLSPTALLTQVPGGKKYMSLYTGPPVYQTMWSGKIARWNTLWMTGHIGATHTVHHTSTNPQVTRVEMRDAGPDDAVHVKYYFGTANRVDCYVKGKRVPPLAEISFNNPKGPDLSALLSSLPHGANFYDRLNGYMEFVLRGSDVVHIRVSNMVVLTTEIAVTDDNFFKTGISGLITNVALLLGIPESRIQVAGVGDFKKAKEEVNKQKEGSSRRRLGAEVASVDIIILEPEQDELSVDVDGSVDMDVEEAQLGAASSDLRDLANKLSSLSTSALLNNTNISVSGTLIKEIVEAPSQTIVGWTCDYAKYNDSNICDCGCGRWDPDCDADGSTVSITIAGCGNTGDMNVSITSATSVQKFCVENQYVTKCDLPEPDDICAEYPCEVGPSTELEDFVKNATGKLLYCKKQSVEAQYGDISYVSDGFCTMALLQNDVPNVWNTVGRDACSSTGCKNGGIPTGYEGSCGCSCPPGFSGSLCETSSSCITGANGEVCQFGGSPLGTMAGGCTCSCVAGRGGANCENSLACTSDGSGNSAEKQCLNNGNVTGDGTYCGCSCKGTWGGTDCGTAGACDKGANNEPCANGGTAIGVQSASNCSCICAPGYTGPHCHTIVPCTTGPKHAVCQNGGNHTGVTGSCSCTCPSGYAGDNCEISVLCTAGKDGIPCENGGSAAGYGDACSCVCKTNFVGVHCETKKGYKVKTGGPKFDEEEGNTKVNVTELVVKTVNTKVTEKQDAGTIVISVCIPLVAIALIMQALYRWAKKHHYINKGDKLYEMATFLQHIPDRVILKNTKKFHVHAQKRQMVNTIMGPGVLLAKRSDGVLVVQLTEWKLAGGHPPIVFISLADPHNFIKG